MSDTSRSEDVGKIIARIGQKLDVLLIEYRAVLKERDALLKERDALRAENDRLVLRTKRPMMRRRPFRFG